MPVIIGGTSYLSFLDSAFPLQGPPVTDGVAVYIGGDTPHVWTRAEIMAPKARYRLPIFVRDNPGAPGTSAAGDVAEAVARLTEIGCPRGKLVDWDSEISIDPGYIGMVSFLLGAAGYRLIDYGSRSFVTGNRNPDGWYWTADWTGAPHVDPEAQMTQYANDQAFDLSLAREDLVPFLWDVNPPPNLWTFPAPDHLELYNVSQTGYRVKWDAVTGPAGQVPASYTVATYDRMGHHVNSQIRTELDAAEYGPGGHGLAPGTYQTHVWGNGAPSGPPHASVIVTVG